jgi:hypothetical protein
VRAQDRPGQARVYPDGYQDDPGTCAYEGTGTFAFGVQVTRQLIILDIRHFSDLGVLRPRAACRLLSCLMATMPVEPRAGRHTSLRRVRAVRRISFLQSQLPVDKDS